MNIDIITLPASRWPEYKALRLEALSEQPAIAFQNDYQEEAAYPDDLWQQRLQDAQNNKNYLLFAEQNKKLCGMICALIDQGANAHHRATACSLYVAQPGENLDTHRRLVGTLLDTLNKSKKILRVQVTVNAENPMAIAFYEDFGFTKVGLLRKYVRLVGDKFQDRLLMEKLF